MPDKSTESATSTSLLVRLQQAPADQAAWAEFVRRYGARIHEWGRRWGLQEADAQDVLLKLVRAMQVFRYDPSQRFHGCLKTVATTLGRTWPAAAGRAPRGVTSLPTTRYRPWRRATSSPSGSRGRTSRNCWNGRWSGCVRGVQPQTWDAFRLTTFEGVPGAEVAARLGMAVTSVYKARSNVLKLLQAEVLELDGGAT